jgi:very-short-patch-repair endonuclease
MLWTTRRRPLPGQVVRVDVLVPQQREDVHDLVARAGVVARRDHRHLSGSFDRLLRNGELVAILPGVYADAGRASAWETRVAAVALRQPDAVLVGTTAARLTFWPGVRATDVECASERECEPRAGFRFQRRAVPPELVLEQRGLRMSVPELTAVDLCGELGGEPIDQALRTRAATLKGMWEAFRLTAGRRGHGERRALLLDSRDEPWSEAERLCHRLLRGTGITGWKSNLPVRVEEQNFFLDVGFPAEKLVLEIDGRLHELDKDVFENDRHRQNVLVLDGWTVLRFTWRMLLDRPDDVVARIRRALDLVR